VTGPGIEFPSSNIYLHIGVGAKIIIYDTGWDNWMWHIPIFTSSTLSTYDSIHYNVDVSTDKIYYTNLSDIPIDSWDVHRVDINIATLSPSEITTTTIQSINKDKILESLTSLEQLKIKFDSLKIISQSIRDYYDSVNKLDKSTCWKEVTLSFEATLLKIDNIISEINTIKDNPTQDDLDKIKNEIKGVKSNVDKIINKIITCATGV